MLAVAVAVVLAFLALVVVVPEPLMAQQALITGQRVTPAVSPFKAAGLAVVSQAPQGMAVLAAPRPLALALAAAVVENRQRLHIPAAAQAAHRVT